PSFARESGFFGDVRELQIAFLMIEGNHRVATLLVAVDGRSIDGKNVELAIIVTVDKAHAAAHGLDHIAFVGRGNMRNGQAGLFADVFKSRGGRLNRRVLRPSGQTENNEPGRPQFPHRKRYRSTPNGACYR